MKKLLVLACLAAILAGLLLSGLTDTTTLIADTSIPANEATNTVSETGNPNSATATIRITMTPVLSPEE